MPRSKVWPVIPTMRFKLQLVIDEIKHLPVEKLEDRSKSRMRVQIEWRGSGRKAGLMPKGFERNCTSKQQIQSPNGIVSWREEFTHACKLRRINSETYRSWIVNLEIQEFDWGSEAMLPIVATAKLDIAEFSPPYNEKRIEIPINCDIRGHTAEAMLKVKLHSIECQTKGSSAFTLTRVLTLPSWSCTRFPPNHGTKLQYPIGDPAKYRPTADSSSDDEPELSYGNIATTNILLVDQCPDKVEGHRDEKEIYIQRSPDLMTKPQPQLNKLLSWNKTRRSLSFKARIHSKGEPLLNKACNEDGGDDIDNERRHESLAHLQEAKGQPDERPRTAGFEDSGRFEVGNWEKRRVVSRDGQMELVTGVFLASIDQRSEKAAGGSACTVLAVIIADWLHNNPNILPLRCQFDELVREGSREWRKLCADENHREKFYDQHFDLNTVIEAKVRPLSEVTEMSYVGFFCLDDIPDGFNVLHGAMSFDSIWNELQCTDASDDQEHIYIASWNDHFFVLKIERESIYLIDTLGERLFEGCNEAYILRFDRESVVYRRQKDPSSRGGAGDSGESTKNVSRSERPEEDHSSSEQAVVCEGIASCKEYIKGFLAALPLKELQEDIKRGQMEEAMLHRRLQIEFHYTALFDAKSL